jgi:hypothetical protein
MQLVNRDAAVAIIRELAKDYMEAHGEPSWTIIVVGGTAMSLRRLRDESEDVDIVYPDDAFRTIAEDLERRSGFRIDVASKNNLWGQLKIHDIDQDAQVVESIDIEGFAVDIAAISPETLFVIKSSSMRDKDRSDLPLLMGVTTPAQIIAHAECLLRPLETRQDREEFLGNILSELQLVLLEEVKPEWFIHAPDLASEHGNFVHEQFGVSIDDDSHVDSGTTQGWSLFHP